MPIQALLLFYKSLLLLTVSHNCHIICKTLQVHTQHKMHSFSDLKCSDRTSIMTKSKKRGCGPRGFSNSIVLTGVLKSCYISMTILINCTDGSLRCRHRLNTLLATIILFLWIDKTPKHCWFSCCPSLPSFPLSIRKCTDAGDVMGIL